MKQLIPTFILIAALAVPMLVRAEPEILPMPRAVERHVFFEKTANGYQILLSRKASERLRDCLGAVGDGKALMDFAKEAAKDLNDPDATLKLEMIAWVVKTQAPALKKALDDKMDTGGATIRVYGVEKKLPERPLLKAIGEAFLPDEVKEQVKMGMKVISTTPLYWKVEGRK